MTPLRRRLWLPLLVALPMLGIVPPAGAAKTFTTDETAESHSVVSSERKTKSFWTEKRMRAADGNDVGPEKDVTGDGSAPAEGTSTDTAPPTTIEPEAPDAGGETTPPPALTDEGTHIAFISEDASEEEELPTTTEGRIFFRQDGMSFTCSGTVVTSANRSVVWTAGHCVNHGGPNWANKWIFVPGYDNGEAPFGKWTASELAAPRGWTEKGSSAFDIGAAILDPSPSGELIADVVGSQGIAWNLSRHRDFAAYGYPGGGSFSGEDLWVCRSHFGWSDPIPGPNPMAIGCNMTYGSSGGGWITELGGGSYLNSVTSYSHVGERDVMYGTYFGDAAARLYASVQG